MPELPEVETTRAGIAPWCEGQRVLDLVTRVDRLRWPLSPDLGQVAGARILRLQRRGKYLLFHTERGCLILHLGMTGSLRIVRQQEPPGKHDHLDLLLSGDKLLRFRDPRRFGAALWTREDPLQHALLVNLGPEPLGADFNADYLYQRSRGRRSAVKTFIMDAAVVVGVGNIYANESLHAAAIRPDRAAGRISRRRYQGLVECTRTILLRAIESGGTTLRDFVSPEGNPGYFRQTLQVYERAGQECRRCGKSIRLQRLGQRSTYFCPGCQR